MINPRHYIKIKSASPNAIKPRSSASAAAAESLTESNCRNGVIKFYVIAEILLYHSKSVKSSVFSGTRASGNKSSGKRSFKVGTFTHLRNSHAAMRIFRSRNKFLRHLCTLMLQIASVFCNIHRRITVGSYS